MRSNPHDSSLSHQLLILQTWQWCSCSICDNTSTVWKKTQKINLIKDFFLFSATSAWIWRWRKHFLTEVFIYSCVASVQLCVLWHKQQEQQQQQQQQKRLWWRPKVSHSCCCWQTIETNFFCVGKKSKKLKKWVVDHPKMIW